MTTKAEARRASLLDALLSADAPVSGGQLANTLNVSRQIIVQDIALLREAGANIVAPRRATYWQMPRKPQLKTQRKP